MARPRFCVDSLYWTNPINPSTSVRPLSMRLFSNILIYAAFAGLIWRPLSFICAFRGEICPSDAAPGVVAPPKVGEREEEGEKAGRGEERESFPERGHNAECIGEDRYCSDAPLCFRARARARCGFCPPTTQPRGEETSRMTRG